MFRVEAYGLEGMKATLQLGLIFWLLLLLAASVSSQVRLSSVGDSHTQIRVERELADYGARIRTLEEQATENRSLRAAERLAAIEENQRLNTYLLSSILLSIVTLLVKDVRGWFRSVSGRESRR